MHEDGDFGPLKSLIESLPGGSIVNMAAANEYLTNIERLIWVMKERCRATHDGLTFQCMPNLLSIHIVLKTVKILNCFPAKRGI